jgi:EmrB/QacA subfamily drug resistance transporter
MALPLFLLTVDFYGMAVALPSIGRDFGAGTTALQWAINAFNLALAAPLIAFGRLGDLIGRRRTLLIGLFLFAVGSALCGGAPDMPTLIAGRIVQGLGVALFSTSPMSILAETFPPDRRAAAFAVWAAVGACGTAVGPLLGGALTDLLSWRWFFLVNLPVTAAAMALIAAVVSESRDEGAREHPDVAGFATVTVGLAALVFSLQHGDDWGWRSLAVLAGLTAGVLLLAGFVAIEVQQSNPLIDLGLFRHRLFAAALLAALTANFGFSALIFFSTLLLQNVLQLTALAGGTVLAVFSACFVVALSLASRLVQRSGERRLMACGLLLMAAAFLLFRSAAHVGGLDWVVVALAIAGIGQGLAFNTATTASMAAVPAAQSGAAAGILNGVRQVGSTLGIAVTGAVFQAVESRWFLDALQPHTTLDLQQQALVRSLLSGSDTAQDVLADLTPLEADHIESIVTSVFGAALHAGMLLGAVVSVLGALALLVFGTGPKAATPVPAGGEA